ncbi:hypothetical protein RB195_003646 [Necator americanus]
MDRCSSVLPSSAIVVILQFTFLFNLIGSISLFTHRISTDGLRSTPILGCAILSACTCAFVFCTAMFFAKMPPKRTTPHGVRPSGARPPTAPKEAYHPPKALMESPPAAPKEPPPPSPFKASLE